MEGGNSLKITHSECPRFFIILQRTSLAASCLLWQSFSFAKNIYSVISPFPLYDYFPKCCFMSILCMFVVSRYSIIWRPYLITAQERNNIFNTIYAIMQVHHKCPSNIISFIYNWGNVPLDHHIVFSREKDSTFTNVRC